MNRKTFISRSAMFAAFSAIGNVATASTNKKNKGKHNVNSSKGGPVVISTWVHGIPANDAAMKVLLSGGSLVDAVEQGVMVVESDKNNTSVGLGGFLIEMELLHSMHLLWIRMVMQVLLPLCKE